MQSSVASRTTSEPKKMVTRWLYKVWAPYKIVIFDGAQNKQCWPESERTLSSLMFLRGILRKSSIRTTCNLPVQVAKHRNQRWWLYKVWVSWDRMPVQISFFTTLLLLLSSCGTFRLASTGQHVNSTNPELESYRGTALAGFEPVTICFRDGFKMPRELGGGGFRWKITVLDSDLPLPLLKQE